MAEPSAPLETAPTPGPVVILIEDAPEIRRFLRATLIGHGYRLVEAETGREGLQAAETRQPDLIILDLGLPDIDGLEVIRRLVGSARQHLAAGGWLIIEFGFGQEAAVREAARAAGWNVARIRSDLQGIPRVAVLRT